MKRYWFGATSGLLITILGSGCQSNSLPAPTEIAIPTVISTPMPTSTRSPIPSNTVTPTNTVAPTNAAAMPIDTGSSSQRILFIRITELSGDYLVDLYTVNSDGSGLTNISNSPEIDEFNPVWLPDGSGIQFIGSPHVSDPNDVGRNPAIYQMRFEDSAFPVLLAPLPLDTALFPLIAWSPDLTHIAFNVGIHRELHVMSVDGSGEVNLGPGGGPSWSPDSTALAFTPITDLPSGMKMVNPAGDPLAFDSNVPAGNPVWSPDGTHLACGCTEGLSPLVHFCVFDTKGDYAIWVADPPEAGPGAMSWSPDGAYIAGVDSMIDRHAPGHAYLLSTNDKEFAEFQMSPSDAWPAIAGGPTWSPDSLKWAFPCSTMATDATPIPFTDSYVGICIFDMNTGGIMQITHELSAKDVQLDWEP